MTEHVSAKANGYNYTIALLASLGSFTYGFNSVVIGSVLGLPSFSNYFDFDVTSSYGASIIDASNGIYTAGGFIGCLIVNWLLDGLGRRLSIQIICAICIISAAIQTASVHISMFLIGRFLNGLGAGMINCAIPIYISEISPAAQRGRLVGFHGTMNAVAYGVVGWAGLGIYFETNPHIQWRLFIALQLCAPLLLLMGSWLLPESPRWLINRDRYDEGLRVLERLHEQPTDPLHTGAKEEFLQIQRQLDLERKDPPGNLFQLFKKAHYRKRLLMGFVLQLMCQTTGILVISNYMVIELARLNVSGWKPLMVLGFYNSWAAFCNVINAMVVDRVGRIRTIASGIFGGIVSLIIVTALVARYGTPDNSNRAGAGAAIAFMFLFVTCYGGCVDASSYIYCSEIFPTNIRAKGVGFAISGVFLMNTVFLTSGGTAFQEIGWKFYLIFIIVPALCLPFFIWFYPETKGLSLEEIGVLFGDKVVLNVSQLSHQERVDLDKDIAALNLLKSPKDLEAPMAAGISDKEENM